MGCKTQIYIFLMYFERINADKNSNGCSDPGRSRGENQTKDSGKYADPPMAMGMRIFDT